MYTVLEKVSVANLQLRNEATDEVIIYMTQGCFEEDPEALLTVKDSQGNTITHLVASSGNTEVFEVRKGEYRVEMYTTNLML